MRATIKQAVYSSLFTRIFVFAAGVMAAMFGAIYFLSVPFIETTVAKAEEHTAKEMLNNVSDSIDEIHRHLDTYRDAMLASRKAELMDIVAVVSSRASSLSEQVRSGKLEKTKARNMLLEEMRHISYGKGDYVWAADYRSYLVSHPDNKLHGTDFSQQRDVRGNLIVPPMVEGALAHKEGFHSYWWRRLGEEAHIEKLTYYKHLPEFELVIGSGMYVDDIDKLYQIRRKAVIEHLRDRIHSLRIAKTGYLYVFDNENIVAHPNPATEGRSVNDLIDAQSGRPIVSLLKEVADKSEGLRYKWDRPDDRGNFVHEKISWVRYLPAFDWYVCSSVYIDELEESARLLAHRMLWVFSATLLLALWLVYLLARHVADPLRRMSLAAKRIAEGDLATRCAIDRTDEVGVVASAFDAMVDRLEDNIQNLDARVVERTTELEIAMTAQQQRAEQRLLEQEIIGEVTRRLIPADASSDDVVALARYMTERVAKAMSIERVSVWLFNIDGSVLECVDLYELSPQRHSAGYSLQESQFAAEFEALKSSHFVDASDALSDPRTAGYVEGYLKPLGITSMLDAMIAVGSRHLGTVCLEHVNQVHIWAPEEIGFVSQLGDQIGLAVLNRERRAAEQALASHMQSLEEANAALTKLDQMKSDFLSSVSHELRTPLTSIRGFASLIEREFVRTFAPMAEVDEKLLKKSDRIKENVGIILKESERLTRLINDVLDLAKIESGRTAWNDKELRVTDLIHDAANAVQGMFEQKPEVSFQIQEAAGLPALFADADKLQQVLVNLLNNAVKFTERGSVTLRTSLDTKGWVKIEVADSGIGFPSEDADRIFDKFQQATIGDTLTDKPKGTGLGLAIAREIVERHSGKIWASSVLGHGSVFTITLPPAGYVVAQGPQFDEAQVPVAHTPQLQKVRGKPTVLVVDDDPAIQTYLSQLLQERNCEVVLARDGIEALSVAKAYRPDLITMDLAMPRLDGKSAIVRLRADPELRHIPVMVVSAIPGWDSAGGDIAMCKPLDEDVFVRNVQLLLGQQDANSALAANILILRATGVSTQYEMSAFGDRYKIDYCDVDSLADCLRGGFKGLVAVPSELIEQIDLARLRDSTTLDVMILPIKDDDI